MSFSIYDILKEADEDEGTASSPEGGEGSDTAATGDDGSADDVDDIDFSLDGDDSSGGDDSGDDSPSGDSSPDTSTGVDSEDEPIEANTDIFSSLSAEEQMIKITELKKQYADLYTSCDDMLDKISDIETTEVTVVAVSRMIAILTNLKNYIMDYLYKQFASKSYYENDVTFNRFLAIFKSVSNVLNDICKSNIQK